MVAHPNNHTAQDERRQTPRLAEEDGIAVRICTAEADEQSAQMVTVLRLTQDVSERGLRFAHGDPLPAGTALKIHLALEMPRKIVTHRGEVRWSKRLGPDKPFSVGVAFKDTSRSDMQVWSNYVESRIDPSL